MGTMTRKSSGGFTIIEVLIVLAIAGLILLIVFLAVPSLQRANRNNTRKKDAEYIATQRVQYNTDNHTVVVAGGFDCSLPHTGKKFCTYLSTGLLYYDLDNVNFHNSGTTAPTVIPTITDPDQILTDTYLKCDANGTNALVAPIVVYAVVLFAVETASGIKQQCIETSVFPH